MLSMIRSLASMLIISILVSIRISLKQLYYQQYYPLKWKDKFVKYSDIDPKFDDPIRQLELSIFLVI